jgi:hypothetical protein
MIAYLEGKLKGIYDERLTLLVGGIGMMSSSRHSS